MTVTTDGSRCPATRLGDLGAPAPADRAAAGTPVPPPFPRAVAVAAPAWRPAIARPDSPTGARR